MATEVSGKGISAVEGETKALSTVAGYVAVNPGFKEVKLYCASAWRLALSPQLLHAIYYNATTYTDYRTYVTDRLSTTHLPLDGMITAHSLYLGFNEIPLGCYFDVGSNVNAETATLDVEYCYDGADATYWKVTGTISGALTVGETVTGGTSGATATLVYSGADHIVVKSLAGGQFAIGETVSGATQTCSAVTAVAANTVAAFFTDVAADSDGTDATGTSTGATFGQDGVYTWTLPAIKPATIGTTTAPVGSKCYWIKITPSATLTNPTDINEIIPVYKNTSYAYMEAGVEYNFALSGVGGLVVIAIAGTPTLNVTWIR